MVSTRPLLRLLLAIALALGTVTAGARAGGMAERMHAEAEAAMAGMVHAASEAADCCLHRRDCAAMDACTQAMCGLGSALPMSAGGAVARAALQFGMPGDQIAAGFFPTSEPPPPRTTRIG